VRRWTGQKNRFFLVGLLAGLLLSFAIFMPYNAMLSRSPNFMPGGPQLDKPIYLLIMGVDEREGDTGRSDSLFLAQFRRDQVRLLSIPRDTMVDIEGHGKQKINAAYAYGGPELTKAIVGKLLGVQVDYHAKINLAGFRHLVDLMGGVKFDVPQPMRYVDPTDGLVIDLKPGPQLLHGAAAEQFVRFRHDTIGDDIGRIHRQQAFLKAAATQALTPTNLPKLPQLLYTARSHVQTDVPVSEQFYLAQLLYTARHEQGFVQETVPGHGGYVGGTSYFIVDGDQFARMKAKWQVQ
jgi:LCP family protein required for cell wall assembly